MSAENDTIIFRPKAQTRTSRDAGARRQTTAASTSRGKASRASSSRDSSSRASSTRGASAKSRPSSSRRASTSAEAQAAERAAAARSGVRVRPAVTTFSRGSSDEAENGRSETRKARPAIGDGLRKALIILGCVAVVVVMLYGPTRNYYVAKRAEQDLSSQLATINASNDSLDADVSSLQTREGIEDEARRRGYVTEGDTAVDMSGVDDGTDSTSASASSSSSSSADVPWYTSVLDVIFQYQSES